MSLPLPPYGTAAFNVFFDGTATDVIVLSTINGINRLVVWEELSESDQITLMNMVDSYTGDLNIVPQAGYQTLNFGGAVLGGDPTGLVDASSAGSQLISYGGAVIGTNPTNFSAGAAEVVEIGFDQHNIVGGEYWTLSSPTTDYYVWYTIQGVAESTVLDFVNHDIVSGDYFTLHAPEGDFFVWFDVDASGIAMPNASGTGIKVDILSTDTPDVVAGKVAAAVTLQVEFSAVAVATEVTITNNTVGSVTNATDTNSGINVVSVTQGIDTVGIDPNIPNNIGIQVSLLTSDLTSDVVTKTAAAVNAIIDFTAIADIILNTVTVTNVSIGDVLNAGGGSSGVSINAVDGTDSTYEATIYVDGTPNLVVLDGSTVQTFDALIAGLNANLTGAIATISGGDIVITSQSLGAISHILIVDNNLFNSTAQFSHIVEPISGNDDNLYSMNIAVDGILSNIDIWGANATTYTDLVNAINTALNGAATAAITGGDIVITSATVPAAPNTISSVFVSDTNLLSATNGFVSIDPYVPGVFDLDDALLRYTNTPNGQSIYNMLHYRTREIGTKPFFVGNVDINTAYFNGTIWVRYIDDTPV